MAEDQNLAAARAFRRPDHPNVIALSPLMQDLDAGAEPAPFRGDDTAEAVHGLLRIGRRFGADKPGQHPQHLWTALAQAGEQSR